MNFLTADVAIVVDASKLPAQLNRAKRATEKMAVAMKKSFKKIGEAFKSIFTKMVKVAKWAGLAIVASLTLTARAAMKQEDAIFLLNAALKISGEFTEELSKQFQNFASRIQEVTIYGDEFVLSLMQQQRSLGVTADKLEEAAKMAIGLATATGRGIESMSMYVALAMQGEFTMLQRYIPALRTTKDETEKLAIITQFAADGFKLAEERALTTSGRLRQLWNVLGDVAERFGMPLLKPIQDITKAIQEWLKGETIDKWVKMWTRAVETVGKKFKDFFYILKTDFKASLDVMKEVIILFSKALVETFLITGYAAGSAMWNAAKNAFKAVPSEEMIKEYLKLGFKLGKAFEEGYERIYIRPPRWLVQPTGQMVTPLELWVEPKGVKIAETAIKIDQLKEEIGLTKLLGDVWVTVGREIFEAIPSRPVDTFAWGKEELAMLKQGAEVMAFLTKQRAEQLDSDKQLTVVSTKNYDAMMSALRFELKYLGDIDDMRQRARTMSQVELETNKMLLLSAEERNEKLQDYMKLFIELQDKQASFGYNIKLWMNERAKEGKNLALIFTNAFDSMADSLADVLMGMTMDWKAFGRMFIKEILAMIIQMQIAFVLKTALGFGTSGGGWLGSLFGGSVESGGGTNVSALAAFAPSLADGGIVTQTGLAKVHKNEAFDGGRGFGNTVVNISDFVGVDIEVNEYKDSDQRILDVTLRAAAGDGTYRRSHNLEN